MKFTSLKIRPSHLEDYLDPKSPALSNETVPTHLYPAFSVNPLLIMQKAGHFPLDNEIDLNQPHNRIVLEKNIPLQFFPPEVRVLKIEHGEESNLGYLLIKYRDRSLHQITVAWYDGLIVSDEKTNIRYKITHAGGGINKMETYSGGSETHFAISSIVPIFKELFDETCDECMLDYNSWLMKKIIQRLHPTTPKSEIRKRYHSHKLNAVARELELNGSHSYLWEFFKQLNNDEFCNDLKGDLRIYIEAHDIYLEKEKTYLLESIKNHFLARKICTTGIEFYQTLGLTSPSGRVKNVYSREELLKAYFNIKE